MSLDKTTTSTKVRGRDSADPVTTEKEGIRTRLDTTDPAVVAELVEIKLILREVCDLLKLTLS